jgi:DNA modification methylase
MVKKRSSPRFTEQHTFKLDGPVECLGINFPDDNARREHFLDILREKLKDPEFRKIEGFPIGSDEDILALSDPPYYTACPNPFITDFIKHYGKPYEPSKPYSREPFAADVSEGKNDPIYNAHSYHTKVPHKAIMRYILHYTDPGDVVFDGFCGTGMAGVAAQLCGDRVTVESLGYRVEPEGTILQQETDERGKTVWRPFSKLGARRVILNDLSPVATFITYNYNTPVDVKAFEREANGILKEVEEEYGWMYRTLKTEAKGLWTESPEAWAEKLRACKTVDEIRKLLNPQSSSLCTVNYTVWSDVFVCPECTNEVVFWKAAVDKEAGKLHDEFPCLHCGAQLTKRRMDRAWVTKFDKAIGQTIRQPKQVPVLINYSIGKKRFEKAHDAFDLALIEKIEEIEIPYRFPTDRMPEGEESRRNDAIGFTHVHHFYTKRNMHALSGFVSRAQQMTLHNQLMFIFTSAHQYLNRLCRLHIGNHFHRKGGTVDKPLEGTLYFPSISLEVNPIERFTLRSRICKVFVAVTRDYISSTQSTGPSLPASVATVDYIFVDPPFGANLMYSELSFLWESWLKIKENNKKEAIINKVQGKGLREYQRLMTEGFEKCFSVLKPGRWMTVEFHNSQNKVWISIQEALSQAGFVVADVRTIDKGKGSFKQVTSAGTVKQDIIISAYKPDGGLEDRFKLEAGTEEGVWDFCYTHLKQLPVFVSKDGQAEIIAERQNYLLFDRMVAFHVQHGVTVPMSAAEFYAGLIQRFSERDGMYFLPEQVAEYDKKRMTIREVLQLQLFVTDESSAIQWLKQQLLKKPQTFQELHPQFLREIGGWQKSEKSLELSEMLTESFLRYDGKGEVPNRIHSYLSTNFKELRNLPKDHELLRAKSKDRWYVPDSNKASDLDKLRERSLLKEFNEYRTSSQRSLKVFRLEAVRAGFKKAWQDRDYTTIITVARKIPENILQEDPKLLMWYDQALTRSGDA